MTYEIQQSTTQSVLLFFLTLTSDHISPATGLSPTVTLSKNGGAFGAAAGAVTEISSGWYKVAGNATDTNTLGPLALHASVATADNCDMIVANIVAYNPQDGVHLGLTSLPNTAVTTNASLLTSGTGTDQLSVASGIAQANVEQWDSVAIAEPATDGIPDVNVKNFNNGAAGSLPTNFSALLVSASGHISNVDTLTTYTGNTVQTGDAFARLGAPVGASTSADIAALKTDLDAGVTVSTIASGATNIKKNTALNNFMFVMTDSTNHNPATGKTVTATRSLDGAAFAAAANSVAEITSGWYQINLASTDMNGNRIALRFTATGCDDLNVQLITQP